MDTQKSVTRLYYERNGDGGYTGRTIAVIRVGDILYFGFSKCNFKKHDHFRKRTGRQIALDRATFAYKSDTNQQGKHRWFHKDDYGCKAYINVPKSIPSFVPEWLYKYPNELSVSG